MSDLPTAQISSAARALTAFSTLDPHCAMLGLATSRQVRAQSVGAAREGRAPGGEAGGTGAAARREGGGPPATARSIERPSRISQEARRGIDTSMLPKTTPCCYYST